VTNGGIEWGGSMFSMAHSTSDCKLGAASGEPSEPFELRHSTVVRSLKYEDRDEHVEKGEMHMFLVADGHGGPQVADLVKSELLLSIIGRAANAPLEDAMHAAFLDLHSRARRACVGAGTTATVVAIDRRTRWITCANVGDSQAYMVLPEKLVPLAVDHRFDTNADEVRRVVGQGGQIGRAQKAATGQPAGPLRAFPGGLAMGRSIGDGDCGGWVLAAPSVQHVQLPPAGGRVVICSDGVWDALDAEAVASIVREAPNPTAAADKVVAAALRVRGLRDDITCTVATMGAAVGRRRTTSFARRKFGKLFITDERDGKTSSSSSSSSSVSTPTRFDPVNVPSTIEALSVKGGRLFRASSFGRAFRKSPPASPGGSSPGGSFMGPTPSPSTSREHSVHSQSTFILASPAELSVHSQPTSMHTHVTCA
jgi:serine/threonine protein phosphatase PrpC